MARRSTSPQPSDAPTSRRKQAAKQRKRRLILAGAVAATLVAGAGGLYVWRTSVFEQRLQDDLALGQEAVERGNYDEALGLIGPYLAKHKGDVPALLSYAIARQNVEEPNARHVKDAINLFRSILELDPDNARARRALMALYVRSGQTSEIISMTEGRADADSLQARAIAFSRTGDFGRSLDAIEQYAKLRPDDFRMQQFALTLLSSQGQGTEALDQIDALEAAAGESPTFDLLRAGVLRTLDRNDEATQLVDELVADLKRSGLAGQRPVVVSELVNRLDADNRDADAMWALTTYAAADLADAPASATEDDSQTLLAEIGVEVTPASVKLRAMDRLVTRNRGGEAVRIGDKWDLSSVAFTEAQANRIRATLAMAEAQAKGKAALSRLDGHDDKWAAFARAAIEGGWPSVAGDDGATLTRLWQPDSAGAAAVLKTSLDLINSGAAAAASPLPTQAAGDAFLALGEAAEAAQMWTRAAAAEASWPRPRVMTAGVLAGGRGGDALQLVNGVLDRFPDHPGAKLARARASLSDPVAAPISPAQVRRDLDDIAAVQAESASTLLPLQILAAVADGDEAGARTLLDDALTGGKLTTAELAALLTTAGRLGDDEIAEVAAAMESRTDDPDAILPLAAYYVRTGNADGLEQVDRVVRQSSGDEWQRARAELATVRGRTEAALLWKELADARPDNLVVQRRALQVVTEVGPVDGFNAGEQLEFAHRAAARVRERIGESAAASSEVPLARAMLSAADGDRAEVGKAAVKLQGIVDANPRLVDARLLLADAFVLLGNESAANSQLQRAAEASNDAVALRLALAGRLLRAGDTSEADRLIDGALRDSQIGNGFTVGDRRTLAKLLTQRRRPADAAAVLAQIPSDDRTLLDRIAGLRGQQAEGEVNAADLAEILAEATAAGDSEAVANARDVALTFYRRAGDTDRADEIRRNLEAAAGAGGQDAMLSALILARTAEANGDFAAAVRWYESAAQNAAGDIRPVAGLARVALMRGDANGLVNAAGRAAGEGDAATVLREFGDSVKSDAAVKNAVANEGGRAVLMALLPDVSTGGLTVSRDAANDLLSAAKYAATAATPNTLRQLEEIADRNPGIVPIRVAHLRSLAEIGRPIDSLGLAAELVSNFPNDRAVLRAATEVTFADKQYPQAANYARQWARVAANLSEQVTAALAAGRAFNASNRYEDAEAELRPFVTHLSPERIDATVADAAARARARADAVTVLKTYAPAAVAADKADDALLAVDPYLTNDSARALAVNLIGYRLPARQVSAWVAALDRDIDVLADTLKDRTSIALGLAAAANRTGDDTLRGDAVSRLNATADAAVAEPGTPPQLLLGLAYGLQLADADATRDKAIELYREALRRNPNYAEAASQLSELLAAGGDSASRREAIQVARTAADAARGKVRAVAFQRLAELLLEDGQGGDAVATQRRAVDAAEPDQQIEARLRLAEMLADTGDAQAAAEELQRVQSSSRSPSDAQRRRMSDLSTRLASLSAAAN